MKNPGVRCTRCDHDRRESMLAGRYWPVPQVPRTPDGKVDIRALCRQWDDEANR